MKISHRFAAWFLAAVCFLITSEGTIQGQGQIRNRSIRRPTTSPYLNLLRRNGGGFGLRYFGTVRPQQELRRATDQLGRSIADLDRRVDGEQPDDPRALETSILSPTGHPTTFFSTNQYFTGSAAPQR